MSPTGANTSTQNNNALTSAGSLIGNASQNAASGAGNALSDMGTAKDNLVAGLIGANNQFKTGSDFVNWLQSMNGKSLAQITSGG